ncbi:type II toxin-antitoxin system RelE/ParE family toxin [Bartonella quintana]|uniref:type II toxin-antitoxin system RelE/ParE family toxin n=1 Tax=Bartonella quintana TaxID=803 RepID=UPI0030B942AC
MDTPEAASQLSDLNFLGYNFHMLRGFISTRYTIHVNEPWCITFAFINGHATRINLEQYH